MKKLSKITESIWSDIQDRSAGETARKEDDINLLDMDGLYEYLKSHYKNTNSFAQISNSSSFNIINVPVIIKGTVYHIHFDFNTNEIYVHYGALYLIKGLFKKMAEKFSLKGIVEDSQYVISPKDGSKVTNTFFIDVIDFITDNIPDPNERGVKKIVNESIWSDIQDRSAGEIRRKEDGVKVHTCIDVDIYLKNASDSYYDELIKEILNYNDSYVDYRVGILNTRDKAYSPEEMKNIRAFEAPYSYLIYDGGHGTDLIAEFWTYDEMKDFDLDDFEDRVIEDDYISICKGIATKLKEVGGDIEYLPRNKGNIIDSSKTAHNHKLLDYYESDYVLQLIGESDVYDWEIQYTDKYGEGSTYTCLSDYKESMIDTFPELDDVDFITWSFNNYACNIGIPITATTVKNFKKYKEYTKNWFTVDEEAE